MLLVQTQYEERVSPRRTLIHCSGRNPLLRLSNRQQLVYLSKVAHLFAILSFKHTPPCRRQWPAGTQEVIDVVTIHLDI